MDDELNIGPRETDYFDDYDMEKAINFFELKQQLADLEFYDPALVNSLRNNIMAAESAIFTINCRESEGNGNELRTWFEYDQQSAGEYQLRHFEMLFSIRQEDINRLFEPDITRTEALAVLCKDQSQGHDPWEVQRPMGRAALKAYLAKPTNNYLLNTNTMNTENLDYLKNNLLNLGFGDKVNTEMEKLIAAKVPEFSLTTEQEYNSKKMDYTLHFKAGEQNEMYFFNRYEASLKNEADPAKDRVQTLYINRGHGVTAKEAFNLLEGRSVEKKLYNKENEPYTAWLKLDFTEKDEYGNHLLNKFSEGYGYDLEKTLAKYPIKELNDSQQKEDLLRALRKGNARQVTIEKDGQTQKYYFTAEPQYKTLNAYDSQMKSVKREQLLTQDNSQEEKRSRGQKQNQENQPDDDGSGKRQSRKQKVH